MLKELKELEEQTRPDLGEVSASKKDGRAFDALTTAAELFDVLAGWAANHTVGLGVAGLAFVPLGPQQARGEAYQAEIAKVDLHEHEKRGGSHEWRPPSPDENRRAARNLLHALSSSRSMGAILRPLCDALDALEYGETLPILLSAEGSERQKRQSRETQLQLKAIGFVAYRQKIENSKETARLLVGRAYGVAGETVRTWETRLRQDARVGRLRVERTIGFAHNAASWIVASRQGAEHRPDMIEHFERDYGTDALQAAGAEFQAFARDGASK